MYNSIDLKISKYKILSELIVKNIKIVLIAILIIIISNLINISIPLITKNIIDNSIKNKDLSSFYNQIFKLLLLIIIYSFINFINIYVNESLGQNILF